MAETGVAKVALRESGEAGRDRGQSWADKQTHALLWEALQKECRLDPSSCTLEVKDRIAYVRGSVETVAQKHAIAAAAKSVGGLKAVVNQLRVAPRSHHSDAHLAARVRDAMAEAGLGPPLPGTRVVDGVVHLTGKVGSLAARKLAEDACRSVPGVEFVVNDTASTTAPACAREAGTLMVERDLQATLKRCLGIDSGRVMTDIKGGIVRLRGDVDSEHRKFLTEDAIRWMPCVVDVVNELTVIPRPSN